MEDGKWVTIKGTHVFIKDGESVEDAIDRTFKGELESNQKVNKEKGLENRVDIDYAIDRLKEEKGNQELIDELESNQKVNKEKGLENRVDIDYLVERMNDTEEKPEMTFQEASENQLKRMNSEYKDVLDLRDEQEDKILSELDATDLFKQLNDEGSDFTFDEDVKIEDNKIKTNVGVFMPDERGYVERELEIPIHDVKNYADLEEKMHDWEDRHRSVDSWNDSDFEEYRPN